jgi:hypothetical protein
MKLALKALDTLVSPVGSIYAQARKALRTHLAAPSEDIETLRRDAERHRWMKQKVKRIPPAWDLVGWDAAIDAAMQEDKK